MRSTFVLAFLALCGCGVEDGTAPLAREDGLTLPPVRVAVERPRQLVGFRQVSFQQEVAPILTGTCAAYCHAGPPPTLVFNPPTVTGLLQRATECSDGRPRVEPGRPEPTHSYLIAKLRGVNLCGNVPSMPPNANPLPEEQIHTVELWISQGAQDN